MTAAVLLLVGCAVSEHGAPRFDTPDACDPVKVVTPKEALQPFNVLVSGWLAMRAIAHRRGSRDPGVGD